MTLPFRRKLFYSFLVIFLLIGTGVIYYSQGYRFDFSTLSATKTGAVYVEAQPRSLDIFLNDKKYDSSLGLIQKGTLISNVLPKKYRLELKKEGYLDYEKNIEVFPSQVARISNVILAPQKIDEQQLIDNVKGNIILDKKDKRIIVLDDQKNIYYLYNLNSPNIINLNSKISSFFRQKIEDIRIYPQEENKIIVRTSTGIYWIDINKQSFKTIKEGILEKMTVARNNLYLVELPTKQKNSTSTDSFITTTDLNLIEETRRIKLPFNGNQIENIDVSQNYQLFILKDGSIWFYNNKDENFFQLAHSGKTAKISPDEKKVFYQDKDGKSFIYFIEDEIVTLEKKKGEIMKIEIIDALKTKQIEWLDDSFHFIIDYSSKTLDISDLSIYKPANKFTIKNNPGSWVYDKEEEVVYLLKEGKISSVNLSF
ncbi:MAG: hypothetical protein WC705_01560 [Candidatus Paceibacterota bacterium]|jgi:hypothetical protein